MQSKSNLRFLRSLILAQCLLFLGGYFCSSLWVQFWVMVSFSVNMVMITLFVSDVYCQTNINQPSLDFKSDSIRRLSFRCSTSYDIIHIRPSTTTRVYSDIIFHLKAARKYTMTSKSRGENGEKMSLYIDASLSTRSIMIIIDYDHERDANTTYVSTLRDLFRLVFERSKFVLGWGDLRIELERFVQFRLFSDAQLVELYPIDLQQMFKVWYDEWINRSDTSKITDHSK